MIITKETINVSDLNAIAKLQPEGWGDIVPTIQSYIRFDFCEAYKFIVNDSIVGVGAIIWFKDTCWFAHIIVDQDFRSQGIGSRIVQDLLLRAEEKSIGTCSLIATDLGKVVYLKAGFENISDYIVFERKDIAKTKYIPSPQIKPFDEKYCSEVLKLDRLITGEIRKELLGFYLNEVILYVNENNQVEGYYLPTLQEGPIYAISAEAGIELMSYKFTTVDKAVIPKENRVAYDFLLKNGFLITNSFSRMTYGTSLNWLAKNMYSRIGGNFG